MKHSPLHARHEGLGAKMADFGGWLMPIEYPNSGVLIEHAAVREKVGLFDVSHLGKGSVIGSGADQFLNDIFTNDLSRISDSQAQYTLLCNDSGGVLDDLIVYRKSATDFFLIPNASNNSAVLAALSAKAPSGIAITNLHEDYAILAVQGPLAATVLRKLNLFAELEYMSFAELNFESNSLILCRTGYTGEAGYELVVPVAIAAAIWDRLATEITAVGGAICGLGARDTLRTEMGYPLHGHELSLEISPVQASATWAVSFDKKAFTGKSSLESEKAKGTYRRLRGLKIQERGIPRAEMNVLKDGAVIGTVTSGTFSPTLKVGIALALVDQSAKIGDLVMIDVRGRECAAEIVKLPFLPSHVK